MDKQFDVVIVHGPNDDETLPYCIQQIKRNVNGYRNIYIVSWDAEDDVFENEIFRDCKIVDENIFPFTKKDVHSIIQTDSRDGWYLQQLLKLYCSFVIEEMLDDYLIVDSDTLFLKQIEFKSGERYFFNMSDENHIHYFEHMKRLHPTFEKVSKFSGISHHMIFNRKLVREMMNMVEKNCDNVFWKAFLLNVDPEQRRFSGASEYEMYFNFMLKYNKDKVIPRKLRFENSGAPVQLVAQHFPQLINSDIWYFSIHAWMARRQPKQKMEKRIKKVLNGENLQMLCDVTVITREIERFHSSLGNSVKKVYLDNINEEGIILLNSAKSIFVYTHILDEFMIKLLPHIENKFVLMTHNSDHGINESHLSLLNDDRLLHMFSQNTFIEHPKLTALPIGIANSMWQHGKISSLNHLINLNKGAKKEQIYVNVSVGTNREHRSKVMNALQTNPLSVFSPQNKPHHLYLEEMCEYKWIASPKGNGVDCHRLWEAMYAGCIALCDDTINSRAFKSMGLPIILVNEWSTISLEWLQEESRKLNVINYKHNVLNVEWWMGEINKYTTNEGDFVLVFLGFLRDYTYDCVKQIRLWNPTQPIYLCINNNEHNKSYVNNLKDTVKIVYIEDLDRTNSHKEFDKRYTNMDMNGFWRYTMERFFVVEECMRKYNLRNIFHLEIDNLVYFKVEELLEKCKSIDKILIPSDSERRYIAGTCFINNPDSLSVLNKFFTENGINRDEMHTIFNFTRSGYTEINTFPTLPPGDNTRVIYEDRRHYTDDIKRLSAHAEALGFCADAAAQGQHKFGVDPIHHKHGQTNSDGFINKDSIFSVDRIHTKWEKKNGLQRLNISVDNINWYPLMNIHVHNKNLKRGMSDLENIL